MVPTVLERPPGSTASARCGCTGSTRRQAQDDPPHLPHGRAGVLGRPDDDWEDAPVLSSATSSARSAAGATGSTTRARSCTWSCSGRAGDLLGREHAARLALERDDDRDRQGSAADRQGQVGTFTAVSRVAVFGAGYVGLVTGACFAELGHDVVVRDVLTDRVERCVPARCRSTSPGSRAAATERRAARTRSTSPRRSTGPSSSTSPSGRRPYSGDADLGRSGRWSTSWTASTAAPCSR